MKKPIISLLVACALACTVHSCGMSSRSDSDKNSESSADDQEYYDDKASYEAEAD